MTASLEQVLANWGEKLGILRATHVSAVPPSVLEEFRAEVSSAAEPWLTWLTEDEARLKSGASIRWLRSQFPRWADRGLARWDGERRVFCEAVVPQRQHLSAVREAARREARKAP